MSNPEQTTTANGQTLCVYSNKIYIFTYRTKSKHSPYSKSFDTTDSEQSLVMVWAYRMLRKKVLLKSNAYCSCGYCL